MTMTTTHHDRPEVTPIYKLITARVTMEGFFHFEIDGEEFGPLFLGSWDALNAVHIELGILECKRFDYSDGSTKYSLKWPREDFGPHPIDNLLLFRETCHEVYAEAALFLAGYHASKEG